VFHTRCPLYRDVLDESQKEQCRTVVPVLEEKAPGHHVYCHFPIVRADIGAAEDVGIVSLDDAAVVGSDRAAVPPPTATPET
jgi:hypothetical protein